MGVILVVGLSFTAAALTDSELTGTVLATGTKQPLPDVVVTATSEALEGERVVVTDAQGQFRIPALPPGVYLLRFDKESFEPFWHTEIDLRPEQTVQVNAELSGGDAREIVLPYVGSPTLDVSSATTGQAVEWGSIHHLAVSPPSVSGASRSFGSLAGLVPGTQPEGGGFSIHGSSPWENGYVVDGLSTQDLEFGANASPLSVEFLQDFEVITGGYMPQYGRAMGGLLQARTRSGSNEFHGSLFSNWVPGFLEGLRTPVSDLNSIVSGRRALQHEGDVGATLGGPLVKDKLWFFAGVAPALSRYEYTRAFTKFGTNTPIPGSSRMYLLEDRRLQAMGKLTYLFNQDHQVTLSVITTPGRSGIEEVPGAPTGVEGPVASLRGPEDNNFTTTQLQYAGVFLNKRLRVDAWLGGSQQTTDIQPVSENATVDREVMERYQASAQATWLLQLAGTHVLRWGVDGEFDRVSSLPGGGEVIIRSDRATGFLQDSTLSPEERYTNNLLGGFVQDSWTLSNRVTVNAGVRYDTPEGALTFALRDQLSPRIGLVVEPLAQGGMKLFAHYAKYRGQLPLGLMEVAFPPGAGDLMPVDPSLLPPSSTELVAGAEYEVLSDTRLSAYYTHRRLDSAIEVLDIDSYASAFLGNPGLGLADHLPKAERTYDGVTLVLSRTFRDGWLAQASYTWSRLYGNYVGPVREDGTVFPSDLGFSYPLENQRGLLPYDRPHTLKLFGARVFHLTREVSASLGLSYLGRSGTPINYLGGHAMYGRDKVFILPRGSSGERTPWVHNIDSNVGVNYRLGGDTVVSFTLDVFNLFNFQRATRVDELYANEHVLPLETPVPDGGFVTPGMIKTVGGEPLTPDKVNRNFKRPLAYQAPRQVRLGLRYTF
ncbi:TonB-dependent receptor [Cystobacter fuscus]|uniref:TonB-dependent receptor n=1 Tax=Cystobacter fuscus TaxID=43 RepID=UPI0006870629|nr:TonB-dependent receptor [Cystobacter fuscus]